MISLKGIFLWKHLFKGVKYTFRKVPKMHLQNTSSLWFEIWTPVWHEGRGPYITIGAFGFAFYRGY